MVCDCECTIERFPHWLWIFAGNQMQKGSKIYSRKRVRSAKQFLSSIKRPLNDWYHVEWPSHLSTWMSRWKYELEYPNSKLWVSVRYSCAELLYQSKTIVNVINPHSFTYLFLSFFPFCRHSFIHSFLTIPFQNITDWTEQAIKNLTTKTSQRWS